MTKIILLILIFLQLVSLGQKNNFKDDKGLKQGIHKDYSGSFLFERTYKNDTLNGYFRKYTSDGTTWEIGYFKKGEQDSLWLEFFKDGTIENRNQYKNGLKQGEFISYFKNGHISYIGTFFNDTLIGEETHFYPNGSIKAKGNQINGNWKEFYQTGNIKIEQKFAKGKLNDQTYYYSKNGKVLLPRLLEPTLIKNDTTISNNTILKIYRLFDTRDSINDYLQSHHFLWSPFRVCLNEELTVHIGYTIFAINSNGVSISEKIDTLCKKNYPHNGFSTNMKVKELKNGEVDISYILEKKQFNSQFGKIEVERKQMQCDDTGHNPLKIIYNNKTIYFKNIGNLLFFEYDSDNDNKKELYVFNYFTCAGQFEIFKITDK